MLGYVTVGVSDIGESLRFLRSASRRSGGKQLFGQDRIKFYGTGPGSPMLAICIPYDQNDPAPGNGNMVAIPGGSRKVSINFYQKAINEC